MSYFRINRYEVAGAIGPFGALALFLDATTVHSELPVPPICFEYFWPVPTTRDSLCFIQNITAFLLAGASLAIPWWLERRSTRKRLFSHDALNANKTGSA
jgi:hypothetical protein